MSDESEPEGLREWFHWFRTTDHGAVVYVREMGMSIAAVLLVGLLLFAVSGVWPPMVAVESGSMEPNMNVGDLVFVMDEQRLAADAAHAGTGVVTYKDGREVGYKKFSDYGDVIIFRADNESGTPIIHRARFWVEEGENWYDRTNPDHIGGADNCRELRNCPAPHAGFITKGDNNPQYDQLGPLTEPVKPAWIVGSAEFGIPKLGYVKLCAIELQTPGRQPKCPVG
ncbi:S26 family signal peptidase [Halosegnis longus]|uniref:S26 family signal peptidase n=1 Tax=Halosegnis longus TaxID=2216012 RepID=A0AAJ4R762_9EURY|nr:S26 family signal peptidase [Salella cibi]